MVAKKKKKEINRSSKGTRCIELVIIIYFFFLKRGMKAPKP